MLQSKVQNQIKEASYTFKVYETDKEKNINVGQLCSYLD